ncbi:MAG TPA: hypothetical protein VIJ29_03695 [Candidatus Paceibacterota bacterium]
MDDVTKQKIDRCVEEFFPMRKGEAIRFPEKTFLIAVGVQISRRALKHIVEQRSLNDGWDIAHIKLLIRSAHETLLDPQIDITNSTGRYPNSHLLGRFDREMNKAVMIVIDEARGDEKFIVTIFRKEAVQFFKLQKNNA